MERLGAEGVTLISAKSPGAFSGPEGAALAALTRQVLGAMALVAASLIYFEGKKERWLAAQIPLVGIMMKHIT